MDQALCSSPASLEKPKRPRDPHGRLLRIPGRKPSRPHRPARPQLLTRDALDKRTNAAKLFDRLVVDIEADLGGRDHLSTIERALIEAFAGAAVTLQHLNTQLALGQTIDLAQHAQAVSAMVRVASRLGLQRRARDVGPTLTDIMREAQP